MKKTNQIILILLTLSLALACGGGGGGSNSSTSEGVGFRFAGGKEGDSIRIYTLDGTFSTPITSVGNVFYQLDETSDDNQAYAEVDLSQGNYRLRYVTDGVETLEYIILSSDFASLVDGTLDLGEINAVTTYVTARAFSSLPDSSEKPRSAASDITSYLSSYFSSRSLGTSFSHATTTTFANSFPDEREWINLVAISFRRLAATSSSGDTATDEANWFSVLESVADIAQAYEDDPDNIPDSVYNEYASATAYLADVSTEAISDVIIGSYTDDEVQNLLTLTQSSSLSEFQVNYSFFQAQEVEDDYARLNLTTGDVTYSDTITLTTDDTLETMVFKKVVGSDNLTDLLKYRNDSETTVNITLDEYYMAVYETTQAQYATRISDYTASSNSNPVNNITQADALIFAGNLNNLFSAFTFSLPTETQWETAARASDSTASDDFDSTITGSSEWVCFDNTPSVQGFRDLKSEPVGERNPNSYGFYDLNGNIAEMCLDYLETATEGASNPVGTTSGNIAIRGGSFTSRKELCTTGAKSISATDNASAAIGFRIVFKK